jgi:hypothetical protein
MHANGTNQKRLSYVPGRAKRDPQWSPAPGAHRLAFVALLGKTRGPHVFVTNDGLGRAVDIWPRKDSTSSPTWSPDGRALAVSAYDDLGSCCADLWIVSLDGLRRPGSRSPATRRSGGRQRASDRASGSAHTSPDSPANRANVQRRTRSASTSSRSAKRAIVSSGLVFMRSQLMRCCVAS